jgi:hypothetical protein
MYARIRMHAHWNFSHLITFLIWHYLALFGTPISEMQFYSMLALQFNFWSNRQNSSKKRNREFVLELKKSFYENVPHFLTIWRQGAGPWTK